MLLLSKHPKVEWYKMIVIFTEFKPVLLPTQKAKKTTNELLGQGIETLFGK